MPCLLRRPVIKQQLRLHLWCPTEKCLPKVGCDVATSARVFPWLLFRVMACHLTFSFFLLLLLVNESEHTRSILLQENTFKLRHPHLYSHSSATEAAKCEESCTTWPCSIVWWMHLRWSTAENEKVSKDGRGMLNRFHWKSTWSRCYLWSIHVLESSSCTSRTSFSWGIWWLRSLPSMAWTSRPQSGARAGQIELPHK